MNKKLKIVLLSSAFNGLTQRAWLEVKGKEHLVSFQLFTNENDVISAIQQIKPDIVICPFLKDRVPEVLWKDENCPIVIIHPGIKGDRGASALDWAITNEAKVWGVTALQAVEEMDAGPIWASHEFSMPIHIRKSALYNSLVSDAAIKCIHDTINNFISGKKPIPLDYNNPEIKGNLQPNMKQKDRTIDWNMSSEKIVRNINAAEGIPGVLADIEGESFYIYDAHLDNRKGEPGKILAKRDEAILVGTGDGSIWIGFLKRADKIAKFKTPAVDVLKNKAETLEDLSMPLENKCLPIDEYNEIHYQQSGEVGVLTFEFYNGAMSTQQCIRMRDALRYAKKQNTKVLVINGGFNAFSNGIHLNTIEAAENPGQEGWLNIQAIDDVCLEILTAKQYTITGVIGSSGAGGVMMALTADCVLAREGIVLNPHYATMGLYGSEYWTYSLPIRVGVEKAECLTTDCLPVSTNKALKIGLIDGVGPRNPEEFLNWISEKAKQAVIDNKIGEKRPFDAAAAAKCRAYELEQMKEDLLNNRNKFNERRNCFVMKNKAIKTPERLIAEWVREPEEV